MVIELVRSAQVQSVAAGFAAAELGRTHLNGENLSIVIRGRPAKPKKTGVARVAGRVGADEAVSVGTASEMTFWKTGR